MGSHAGRHSAALVLVRGQDIGQRCVGTVKGYAEREHAESTVVEIFDAHTVCSATQGVFRLYVSPRGPLSVSQGCWRLVIVALRTFQLATLHFLGD